MLNVKDNVKLGSLPASRRSAVNARVGVWLLLLLPVLALSGCGSTPQGEITTRKALRVDFSGSWEMDYSLNDRVEAQLDAYFYQMRRSLGRESNHRQMEGQRAISHRSAQTVLDMAQFVDKISRVTVMEIEQTYTDIHIDREDTFSLDCQFPSRGLEQKNNPFATEVCGWDGHQLVFQLRLPEGLMVQQRFSLSANGSQIHVATTMYSDRAPAPFTLNRSYSKYDKRHRGYTCEQTVSKGKVCRLVAEPDARPAAPQAPKPILMNADE